MEVDFTYASALALALCILGFFIRKWINDSEKRADERALEFKTEIKSIREFLNKIRDEVASKISREECRELSGDKWLRIYNHEHEILCKSKDCTARHTTGVIVKGVSGREDA